MPINILDKLPAKSVLEKENIFVMGKKRAIHQDIRPLKIALVNLMPNKIETETQIIRMLSNTPLQIEFDLINMTTHASKNTSREHLDSFYKTFEEVRGQYYDGMIITGTPLEKLNFEEVDYWEELKKIFNWADKHVTSTLFLCWAGQAALYYYYGVKKHLKPSKVFGVFPHRIVNTANPLLRGFDEGFLVPHARNTEVYKKEVEKIKDLEILAESDEAGLHIVASKDNKRVFVFGHPEYDSHTLKYEFDRDRGKGISVQIPKNYFPKDDPDKLPLTTWRSNGFLFYSNWLNYYVYQTTPYNWVNKK